MEQRLEIVVGPEVNKKRLDEYLFSRFGSLSKMYLRHIVKDEKCEVNGRWENVGYRLRPNDFIEIELDPSRETSMRPQPIALDVIYEDEVLLVVNKPAGMLVHPTNRNRSGTLLNGLSYYLNHERPDGETIRPGLIHRLDKQTSGLIVTSKDRKVHTKMMESFRQKFVEKRYVAVVEGIVENDNGIIDAPIGRFGELKYWGVKEDGKSSETRYWVKERRDDITVLELQPVTGRTNQLRIHCEHIGHPIIGDTERGGRSSERLRLHAYSMSFRHPRTKEPVTFQAMPEERFYDIEAE